MTDTEVQPRLYIVMREDLWDMNPGKGMAQAAHANGDFDAYVAARPKDKELQDMVALWKEGRNFGVTLTLHGPLDEMDTDAVDHAGFTVDPTYPYRNWYGKVFTREEITCMWAFVWTEEDIAAFAKFPLHQ